MGINANEWKNIQIAKFFVVLLWYGVWQLIENIYYNVMWNRFIDWKLSEIETLGGIAPVTAFPSETVNTTDYVCKIPGTTLNNNHRGMLFFSTHVANWQRANQSWFAINKLL